MTIFRHLSKELKLKPYKPSNKTRITLAMKANSLIFIETLPLNGCTAGQGIILRQVYPSTVCYTQAPHKETTWQAI